MGEASSYLNDAEDLLDSARDNLEKDYPAAALLRRAGDPLELAREVLTRDWRNRINEYFRRVYD